MFFPKDTWSLNWWISAKRSLLDVGAVSAVHFVDVAELRHNVFADVVVAAVLLFLPLHHQNQKTQATPVMVNCLRIGRRRIWSVTFISDFIFSDTFLRLIKSDLLQASVLACFFHFLTSSLRLTLNDELFLPILTIPHYLLVTYFNVNLTLMSVPGTSTSSTASWLEPFCLIPRPLAMESNLVTLG